MRFLARFLPPPDVSRTFLASMKAIARGIMVEVRNPKWTSYGALEIDVFARSRQDFELFLAAVEPLATIEFSRDLNVVPPRKSKPAIVAEAREYFNSERYWEAHEALEAIWRGSRGEEKSLLQGLILVCAALVHHQKGEDHVGIGILRRAMKQLSYDQPTYHGIAIQKVVQEAEDIIGSNLFRVFRI